MNSKQKEEALTLEILEAIDERSDVTQRHLARRAGVALGLANSYLKRCMRKGLVKMHQAPANRYLYYLTPKGFAEKSRLTAEYLSHSFTFYRRASQSCVEAFDRCRHKGWDRIVLCGASDLAEIAALRALEQGIELVGLYDPTCERDRFVNLEVHVSVETCGRVDAWVITTLDDPPAAYRRLATEVRAERIVVPGILGLRPD